MQIRSKSILFLTFVFVVSISSTALLSCSGKVSNSCTPQCDGLQCGDNGCGGNCGLCEDPTICRDGQCVSPGECQPPCDEALCQVCVHEKCESRCFGTEVCNNGICEEPICDPPCDGNTRICSDLVCKTFAELKNEYIGSHPGQAIIPYPWEPITSTRVLPFDYEVPAAPGNEISISACRDEFEAASFVLTAQKNVSGVQIVVSNLTDGLGNTIPSSAIDIHTVKVWYQGSLDSIWEDLSRPRYLVPELLLKDDSLIHVDYVNKINYIRATIGGVTQYYDTSSGAASVSGNSSDIRDAETLQPFSIDANENRQIWMTTHVPKTATAGNYTGTVAISAAESSPIVMVFHVRVLPFDLAPSQLIYSLFYVARLFDTDDLANQVLTSSFKTAPNMLIELQDMYDHGVQYPTFAQDDNTRLETVFQMRDAVGFPKDRIFNFGTTWNSDQSQYIGNPTDEDGLADLATRVSAWINIMRSHGYQDVYFYALDEASPPLLQTQKAAWDLVRSLGGKMLASSYLLVELVNNVLGWLDAALLGYQGYSPSEAATWHNTGAKVFQYNYPQVGVENPETYRRHYGLELWNSGYDGMMNMGYQSACADIWNDFDCPDLGDHTLRDHEFTYPTRNGIVGTIQWEGQREGIDDTRYLATLISIVGNDTLARSIVAESLASDESMTTARKKMIDQILLHRR
jgi:hypothetical protein